MTVLPQPVLFADFTTEGGSNLYFFQGAQFAGAAAWLTAVGGTFSRGSTSMFTNSSGVLTQAGSNVLRFDFDPTTHAAKGILLEGASTNNITQSAALDNAAWTKFNCTISADAAVAPDGSTTADKIVEASDVGQTHQVNQTCYSAGSVAASVYAKAAERIWLRFSSDAGATCYFNLSTGTVGTASGGATASISAAANGFFRCSIVFTAAGGGGIYFGPTTGDGVTSSNGDGSSGIFAWGAQQEALSFASSYIPTTSSSATRQPDLISFSFAQNSFTSYLSLTSFLVATNVLLDGGGHNIAYDASLGFLTSNATNQLSEGITVTTTAPHRVASCGTSSGRFIAFDGNNTIHDNNSLTNGAQSSISMFSTNGNFSAAVAQVGYWNEVFSQDQLGALTTLGASFSFLFGPLVTTTLVPAKAFTRKHYEDLLEEIREEVAEEREAVGDLDEKGLANRNFEIAQRVFHELESNLTPTNYAKMMDARERLESARKARDHHYFMEIVNKEWAKYNSK